MTVTFQDLQDLDDSMNGARVETPAALAGLFRSLRGRKPFMFELRRGNGPMLTVGLAGDCGSVQFSPSDGKPPYEMAVGNETSEEEGFVDFLVGNTPTPVPQRFCLPIDKVLKVAEDFLLHGSKSSTVRWDEI